jgi:hypothetical protein
MRQAVSHQHLKDNYQRRMIRLCIKYRGVFRNTCYCCHCVCTDFITIQQHLIENFEVRPI